MVDTPAPTQSGASERSKTPALLDIDGAELIAAVIVVSDRVAHGERRGKSGPVIVDALQDAGCAVAPIVVVPEGSDAVATAIDQALASGAWVVFTSGGTGLNPRNRTPEVTAERITTRLTGLENQVLIKGLQASDKAGLARGIIGLTARSPQGSLIVNAPGSSGGAADAVAVIAPLIPSIFNQLGARCQ